MDVWRLWWAISFFKTFPKARGLRASQSILDSICTARVWTVGKPQTPTSSFRSLRWRLSPVRSKNFTVKSSPRKCFEHKAENLVGFQCARLSLTKSTHFFLLFLFCGSSAPLKGIGWSPITSFRFRVLLHTKRTQASGIFAEQLVDHRACKRNPGMVSWIVVDPDPILKIFHSVMFQTGAFFVYFENSQKKSRFQPNFCGIFAQCDI